LDDAAHRAGVSADRHALASQEALSSCDAA
jgi:hypothetical protein